MPMRTKGISVARVKGCISEYVARVFFLFYIYESGLRTVNHPIHTIFNVDET